MHQHRMCVTKPSTELSTQRLKEKQTRSTSNGDKRESTSNGDKREKVKEEDKRDEDEDEDEGKG